MSSTARTWIAGVALALSILIILQSSDTESVGTNALLAMLGLFIHVWIVAVAERVGSQKGGTELRRFPLGPRLLRARPSVFPQIAVLIVLLGAVTGQWPLAAGTMVVAVVAYSAMLRSWMPFVLPALGAVFAILNMTEFHTLGDLAETARIWLMQLLTLLAWSFILSGSLLRNDASGRSERPGRILLALAGLPGYLAAFYVFSLTPLSGRYPDLIAAGLTLLVGGLLQTLLITGFQSMVGLKERLPGDARPVTPSDVGRSLFPLLAPLFVGLSMAAFPMDGTSAALGAPVTWLSLFIFCLVIPAVPAAALVAGALDRIDGRGRARVSNAVALALLGVWFVGGPLITAALYSASGPMQGLGVSFPMADASGPLRAGLALGGSRLGAALGGDLAFMGLPAADLMRATTLLLVLCAMASRRMLRHAQAELVGVGWSRILIMLMAQGLAAWWLTPRTGPLGACLAGCVGAGVIYLADLFTEETIHEEDEPEMDFDSPFELPPTPASEPQIDLEADAELAFAVDMEPDLGEMSNEDADSEEQFPVGFPGA